MNVNSDSDIYLFEHSPELYEKCEVRLGVYPLCGTSLVTRWQRSPAPASGIKEVFSTLLPQPACEGEHQQTNTARVNSYLYVGHRGFMIQDESNSKLFTIH